MNSVTYRRTCIIKRSSRWAKHV